MRVLLVDDNRELVSLLVKGLRRAGFAADSVGSVGDAQHELAARKYAAVVLDLGLPDRDGLTLLRAMRRSGDATKVLVLTGRDSVSDRVAGLRDGADDYLPKPFAMAELVARLQALMRRPAGLLGRSLMLGNVSLDTEGRLVLVKGAARRLPERETAVLEILLRCPGNVVPKRVLEDHLFGMSGEGGSNAVEVYVHRLRRVLDAGGANVKIHTVRGVGYRMLEDKAG